MMDLLSKAIGMAEDDNQFPILSNHSSNPDQPPMDAETEGRFRIYVPMSGGVDSSTLVLMAHHAGLPVVPVHIWTEGVGQEYELEHAQKVMAGLNLSPITLHTPDVNWIEYGGGNGGTPIWRGRNLVYIAAVAQYAIEQNHWGQIWFGNHGGAGESGVTGSGDKGFDFFWETNQFLAANGSELSVVSPLIGMNKSDMLRWAETRGLLPRMRNTYSCYRGHRRGCGRCWQCFALYSIFLPYGVQEQQFPDGVDFAEALDTYYQSRGKDFTYSENRMSDYEPLVTHLESKKQ